MSQLQLEAKQEYVDQSGSTAQFAERIGVLEDRLGELESSLSKVKRDAVVIVLSLLTESLRHVASGKMDIAEVIQPPVNVQANGKWEAVKQGLAPRLRDAVDVFLVRGTMNNSQLAAALRIGRSNCSTNVIGELRRQGLLIKSGNDYSLKTL
jgi:hypothetical protein